jgi:hypothetical protein
MWCLEWGAAAAALQVTGSAAGGEGRCDGKQHEVWGVCIVWPVASKLRWHWPGENFLGPLSNRWIGTSQWAEDNGEEKRSTSGLGTRYL